MATRKKGTRGLIKRHAPKDPKPTRGGQSGFGNPHHSGARDPNPERSREEQHEDAMRVLRAEYYQAVRGLAQEVVRREKDGEDLNDVIHEIVDGSYWVIYTHANFQVLMCTDHHDAYMEDFGDVPVEGRDGLNWAALAYAALARDVAEQLDAERMEEAPRRTREAPRRTHRPIRRGR